MKRAFRVISEMEFAGRYLGKARTICVTGSNGKTTTTSLIYKILRDAGYNVSPRRQHRREFRLLGRYRRLRLVRTGVELVPARRHVPVPRAHIGVLTNITPDHLDRYDYCFQNYVDAKMRITQNQNSRDFFIYSGDDEVILAAVAQIRPADEAAPPSRPKTPWRAAQAMRSLLDGKLPQRSAGSRWRSTRPKCGFPGCTTLIMLWRRRSQRSRPEYPDPHPQLHLRLRAGGTPARTRRRDRRRGSTSTTRKPPTSIPHGTH